MLANQLCPLFLSMAHACQDIYVSASNGLLLSSFCFNNLHGFSCGYPFITMPGDK